MKLPAVDSVTKHKLAHLGVQAVYLFGSRAQGVHTEQSDYDFAVLLDATGQKRGGKIYNDLYDILSPLCERSSLVGDVIDIIFLRDAPLELQMHVVRYGKVIADINQLARLNFESTVTVQYCDFRPLLDTIDQAILARL